MDSGGGGKVRRGADEILTHPLQHSSSIGNASRMNHIRQTDLRGDNHHACLVYCIGQKTIKEGGFIQIR